MRTGRIDFSRQKFFGFFVSYRYPAFCLLDAYVRVSGFIPTIYSWWRGAFRVLAALDKPHDLPEYEKGKF